MPKTILKVVVFFIFVFQFSISSLSCDQKTIDADLVLAQIKVGLNTKDFILAEKYAELHSKSLRKIVGSSKDKRERMTEAYLSSLTYPVIIARLKSDERAEQLAEEQLDKEILRLISKDKDLVEARRAVRHLTEELVKSLMNSN
jgi:hypothetical protein